MLTPHPHLLLQTNKETLSDSLVWEPASKYLPPPPTRLTPVSNKQANQGGANALKTCATKEQFFSGNL